MAADKPGTPGKPEARSPLVVIEMSMSLDGFVAGPDDSMEHRLGTRGGEHVFDWFSTGEARDRFPPGFDTLPFRPEGANRGVVAEMFLRYGACLAGKRTYTLAEGWGGRHPLDIPAIVLTHTPDPKPPGDASSLIFVTGGIARAVQMAKEKAGEKDVYVLGASVGQQALKAGLVDEIFIHVAPILLGAGVRMFDSIGDKEIALDLIETTSGPGVSHLRYGVRRG